jgi:hypothetical protein
VSLSSVVAKLGENSNFVAFNAHWGFAYFVTSHIPHGPWFLIPALVAAFKEFVFDPHYETNPPQNIWPDGAMDFAGYATGIALGWFL